MESKPSLALEKILIIAAMDVEFQAVQKLLPNPNTVVIHKQLGIFALEGTFATKRILLVQSGVGLVNAGLTTAYANDWFKPTLLIQLGVAGALSKDLLIGDTVVADKIIQHDSIFSGESMNELMAPGELFLSISPEQRKSPMLLTDTHYTHLIKKVLLSQSKIKPISGTVLSGSEFVGNSKRKILLSKLDSKACAVEMEAAAVAMIATKFSVPFVVIKTIADRLHPDGSISSDYLKFAESASHKASLITRILIEEAF